MMWRVPKKSKKRLKNRRIALLEILSTSDDEEIMLLGKNKSEDEEEQIVFDNDDTVHELLSSLDEQNEGVARSVSTDPNIEEENDLDDLKNILQQM